MEYTQGRSETLPRELMEYRGDWASGYDVVDPEKLVPDAFHSARRSSANKSVSKNTLSSLGSTKRKRVRLTYCSYDLV